MVGSLHPAYTVTNINDKICTLGDSMISYSTWPILFRVHAKAYNVLEHIDNSTPPAETDVCYEQWKQIDALVVQWIYNTLSNDLLVQVLDSETTARAVWIKIQNIISEKRARAAALEQEFSNLTISACSSVDAYCQRLRYLVGEFREIGSPVDESRIFLQINKGLPREYNTLRCLINTPPLNWDSMVSYLQFRELQLRAHPKKSSTED